MGRKAVKQRLQLIIKKKSPQVRLAEISFYIELMKTQRD